jgi:YbbR domain-containing protein
MFRFHPVDPAPRPSGNTIPRLLVDLAIAIAAVLLACVLWTMVSCSVTTTTTRTTSAKGHVVETVTVTKSADPAALQLAGTVATVATAYAPPRARIVRQEKSGPITPQEIAHRWQPVAP